MNACMNVTIPEIEVIHISIAEGGMSITLPSDMLQYM